MIHQLDFRNERNGRIKTYSFSSLGVLKNKDTIYRNEEQNKKTLGYWDTLTLNFPELHQSKLTLMIETHWLLPAL